MYVEGRYQGITPGNIRVILGTDTESGLVPVISSIGTGKWLDQYR